MKALFLIYHGFEEANGISKKIQYQVKALKECGVDVHTCYLIEEGGEKRRMIDNKVLKCYGNGWRAKIKKRTWLGCIYHYVVENEIDLVYVRCDHNTTPFIINLYRRLQRKGGIKVVMEVPTYPYDQEYKNLPLSYQRVLLADKCLRGWMAKYIDKIVTFSDDKEIFGRPTIRIANGIDFDAIPLKQNTITAANELHLIAVATIHPWHGFDRAIQGLANYYVAGASANTTVHLHVVGQGVPAVVKSYHRLAEACGVEKHVTFHGPLFGKALDEVFDQCQMGIGSLARHRSGITHLRSLKNREYAARGIPFVYSEIDNDFEQMPYVLKVPADETPLDMAAVVNFYRSMVLAPQEIRASIEQTLSWNVQMKYVIENL